MNEEQIFEILNSYKDAIDVLLTRCDEIVNQNRALEERMNKLESIIFDEILEPARLALEADDRDRRFGEFNEKYGERLGAFDKVLGAAEGNPDFSMAKTAFDEAMKCLDDLEKSKAKYTLLIIQLFMYNVKIFYLTKLYM